MKKNKKLFSNRLINWMFNIPASFALILSLVSFALLAIYALVTSVLNSDVLWPLTILLFGAMLFVAYFIIKKIDIKNMSQTDFVAITNGYSLIAIAISIASIITLNSNTIAIRQWALTFYVMYPALFISFALFMIWVGMYIIGTTIFNLYATYKRANEIGISKWKIICSWPFGFLLMLMPGYLLKDSKSKSDLTISANWYKQFNKWVLENKTNLISTFLLFILLKNAISGWTTLIYTTGLMVLYLLWNVKHKKDLLKNINSGYALSAVMINCVMFLLVLLNTAKPIIIIG